jgi:DnaJ-class molecular chaperone
VLSDPEKKRKYDFYGETDGNESPFQNTRRYQYNFIFEDEDDEDMRNFFKYDFNYGNRGGGGFNSNFHFELSPIVIGFVLFFCIGNFQKIKII